MNRKVILSRKRIDSPVTIQLPVSKSECNRALILSFISQGNIEVSHLSDSDDTQTLIRILQNIREGSSSIFDCGPAGTTFRFLTAALSIHPGEYILTGNDRMKERPIKELVEALRSLGANIIYLEKEGFPPLKIKGQSLEGGTVDMNPSISSQFVSALMMIAPALKNGLKINFKSQPVSYPYIQMTASMMKACGANIQFTSNDIQISSSPYSRTTITCESDWSAASYFYGCVAIHEKLKIILPGLKENSLQGDARLNEIFQSFGVETLFKNHTIELFNNRTVSCDYFEYDFTDCPDLAPTLAFTCCALRIPGKLTGLSTLKNKETDRIIALKNEMKKCGMKITATNDSILFSPENELPDNILFETYGDHRMAMSAMLMALVCHSVEIENQEVVSKSFPEFWKECSSLFIIK